MRRDADDVKPSSPHHHQTLRYLDLFLGLSSVPLTVASVWVMAKNKENNDVYGKVESINISGLKYLVFINAISAGYAMAAAVFSHFRCFINDWVWVFFLLDQAVAYLMVTSGSAVIELLYLVEDGDRNISWSQVCGSYGKFCSGVRVSLALHLTALVCFIVLSLVSAYRLFSNFEPPSVPSKEVVEQGE